MKPVFVWAVVIFNTIAIMIRSAAGLMNDVLDLNPAEVFGFILTTIVLSVMGALVVLRADGNRVGWLMLLLGVVLADPFRAYIELNFTGQGDLSAGMYFAFWTQGWFFFVILYAIFLILLHFPDGRPPTRRWNFINIVSLATFGQYILAYTFQPKFGDGELFIENPIALLPVSAEETFSGLLFGLGMILLWLGSLVSIFVRYRQAGVGVRAQIKWLLFAGVIAFSAIGYRLATYTPAASDWTDYLLTISLLVLTLSITVAILRYRLYDIDIIIRRTLQYALVTAILGFVFLGGVVVSQSIFQAAIGSKESSLITVISTLLIAALFNPVRSRTQRWIDRRFYRAKYDAEKAMADFAETARAEMDLNLLSSKLAQVIMNTMQPKDVQLLLKPPKKNQ